MACDSPHPNEGGQSLALPIRVSGWAYSPHAVQAVFVLVDGRPVRCSYGIRRPDVADALADPSALESGFTVLLGPRECPTGQHRLDIVAVDSREQAIGLTVSITALPADMAAKVADPPTLASGAGPAAARLSPELEAEVYGIPWMYPWRLGEGVVAPVADANLPPVHMTRAEMVEPVVREALAAAGAGAVALDLACNEGWFSHRLLDWGAGRVLGVDLREQNVHRARLVRDHFGIAPERMEFIQGDAIGLDRDELGRFDVILMLGLIYHLERPLEALRVARSMCRGVCLIESQLTRQDEPIAYTYGTPDVLSLAPASFAAWVEDEPDNRLASATGVMSLVPNRAALASMPRWAGFESVEFLAAQPHHDRQYVQGDRAVVVAS
jgi:tRNA (mo5U34)-methyltransferase